MIKLNLIEILISDLFWINHSEMMSIGQPGALIFDMYPIDDAIRLGFCSVIEQSCIAEENDSRRIKTTRTASWINPNGEAVRQHHGLPIAIPVFWNTREPRPMTVDLCWLRRWARHCDINLLCAVWRDCISETFALFVAKNWCQWTRCESTKTMQE